MKILVADDSKTTLSLVTKSLVKLGHEVLAATSGEQAIESYKKEHPDLIILDVIMEGIDGFETAKIIRSIQTETWIPIIFLSGAVDDENIARGINAGGDDYLTKPFSEITLAAKIKAMQRIAEMQHKLYDMTRKLSVLSSTDTLTEIHNRFEFNNIFQEKLAYADQHNQTLALLFLDLDHFKAINDSLGHKIGDMLLKEVAKRLCAVIRQDDFIARIGGDEFAIIINNITDPNMAANVAQKLLSTLSAPYDLAGNILYISASIGISYYPSDESNPEILLQNADIAMYHAKELGRNNYQFFTKTLEHQYKLQLNLEHALRNAILKNQLFLMYKPILDLKTKKIKRIEAIAGWQHHELGYIPARVFIPLAEELGLIESIGNWIIQTACEQSVEWFAKGFQNCKLVINLSSRQLIQKNLPNTISNILATTHLSPQLLELELAETSTLVYSTTMESILNELHMMDIGIALDNFGTGYSSLSHIKRLPLSAIKIAKIFISDMLNNPNDATLVKSVISLINNAGIESIAEGVENEEQIKFLIENNCSEGQGNYLCPIKSATEIKEMLEEQKAESYT